MNATTYATDQMEGIFDSFNYFPSLENTGGGNYVFFFYDLPNEQRLGINEECIVLYCSNPDCEGEWSYYFPMESTLNQKVIQAMAIFDLVRNSSPLYK
jgi:hypothetical protein